MYIQDYVMVWMMGMHAPLGADSSVLLLDHDVAVCIAQIIIADKWSDSYYLSKGSLGL
jgi:hypothetical protein